MKKITDLDKKRFSCLLKTLYSQTSLNNEELEVLREMLTNLLSSLMNLAIQTYPKKSIFRFIRKQKYLSGEQKFGLVKIIENQSLLNLKNLVN